LIGGQMVLVHAFEAGVHPPRLSADLDVLVNARVVTGGVRGFVQAIEGRDSSWPECRLKESPTVTTAIG